MKDELYIPKRLKVGFQERSDTFTKKLAYIIYFDDKGVLRKEKSWQSWRDKKIEPIEYDNSPISGFCLNKDVKRGGWEWHSNTRTMIRVHDPRNFEFEITTQNLIGVLMNTDCSKRGLVGDFVYAWYGTELVLLPVCSEEYENSVKYTKKLESKVSIKSLTPGITYSQKRSNNPVVYLGKFNWYEYKQDKNSMNSFSRIASKKHVFYGAHQKEYYNKDKFFYVSGTDFLSSASTTEPVPNFSELVENFGKKTYSSEFKVELKENTDEILFDDKLKNSSYHDKHKTCFIKHKDAVDKPVLWKITITPDYRWNYSKESRGDYDYTFNGFTMSIDNSIDLNTGSYQIVEYTNLTFSKVYELIKTGTLISNISKSDYEHYIKNGKYRYYASYGKEHSGKYHDLDVRKSLSDFVFYNINYIFPNGKTKLLKMSSKNYYLRDIDRLFDND